MRPALRLFASVTRNAQFAEAGAPTGLTGLLTHSSPRSTLLYIYNSTLEQLKQFPEHSVYRQSTEALTKHRMSVLESVKPEGLEEWQKRIEKIVDAHPEAFRKIPVPGGSFNIVWREKAAEGMKTAEWDDEYVGPAYLEGPRTLKEREKQGEIMQRDVRAENAKIPRIEPEPAMTLEQCVDLTSSAKDITCSCD